MEGPPTLCLDPNQQANNKCQWACLPLFKEVILTISILNMQCITPLQLLWFLNNNNSHNHSHNKKRKRSLKSILMSKPCKCLKKRVRRSYKQKNKSNSLYTKTKKNMVMKIILINMERRTIRWIHHIWTHHIWTHHKWIHHI